MKKRLFIAFIAFIALLTPIIIAVVSKFPIFGLAPGNFNSWISYWGSYLGALIGASVVYFVSKKQIDEQNKLQIEAIKQEHIAAMEQYYFRLELEKIEEFISEVDRLDKIITEAYNDFVKYLVHTEALYGGRDKLTEEQKELFTEEVKVLRIGLYKWINQGYSILLHLKKLSFYIEESKNIVISLEITFDEYISEIKATYRNNRGFEKYFDSVDSGESKNLLESRMTIVNLFNHLNSKILQSKLEEKILILKNTKLNN